MTHFICKSSISMCIFSNVSVIEKNYDEIILATENIFMKYFSFILNSNATIRATTVMTSVMHGPHMQVSWTLLSIDSRKTLFGPKFIGFLIGSPKVL